jgi:2,4-dienoyl-CoA reductase-like NADH-dependent reductase (Old Yellow Enzyme family)
MISLLDPIQIGEIHLPNRVIMSPLTRLRGTPEHIPTQLMAEYYAQRAGAGLIISEGIPVVPQGLATRMCRGSGRQNKSKPGNW